MGHAQKASFRAAEGRGGPAARPGRLCVSSYGSTACPLCPALVVLLSRGSWDPKRQLPKTQAQGRVAWCSPVQARVAQGRSGQPGASWGSSVQAGTGRGSSVQAGAGWGSRSWGGKGEEWQGDAGEAP